MEYKKFADDHGRDIYNQMLQMKYWKWKDGWKQTRDVEDNEKFAENRDRLLSEQLLHDYIYPYVAYVTAPSIGLAQSVIDTNYVLKKDRDFQIKRALGVASDPLGMDVKTTMNEAFANKSRFEYRFKKIAEWVEKGLNKMRYIEEVAI